MKIFPAIDIKDNKAVRLKQGKFNEATVYSDNPLDMAKKWIDKGADFLHIVDLDGAETENIINEKSIIEIINKTNVKIQIGGGIRNEKRIKSYLKLGVERVIIGTMAVENPEMLKQLAKKYSKSMAVSVDAVDGYAAIKGWKEITKIHVLDICKIMEEVGIKTLIYTDILKDGMLKGPNFKYYKILKEKTKLKIIASGGISSIKDLEELDRLNIYGAIIGKALYNGDIDLEEAYKCLQKE
ncbi:MAG: 1-(5-phosphoribosyl)-5-[(5-phosphoribosylamino)methylideneamino]imidazole-4-carboxamide isomerase [Bacillota bacterium]|nr:1-(5-phosphoribosyl)-5-[(5-phosphoribosylamino)methylideneamino]imidazole-4-carboxamide isomerase [Bacillota bacterium]